MQQLLVHLFGDFICQNSWMALNKSKKTFPCLVHILIYTSCFLLLTTSWKALLVIGVTHFFIDRFHTPLKRFIWFKQHFNPKFYYPKFVKCDTTGLYDDSPFNTVIGDSGDEPMGYNKRTLFFISMWLYIIHDNFLHLAINYLALKYLS